MASRLKVSGLAYKTNDATLKTVFGAFGGLSEAKIATDWETGRSRCFGHVSFEDEAAAEAAVAALDGSELDGKRITVEPVTPKQGAAKPAPKPVTPARGAGPGRGGGGRNTPFG